MDKTRRAQNGANITHRAFQSRAGITLAALTVFLATPLSIALAAASPPPIRTSAQNTVPACVTPGRLDSFLSDQIGARGYQLDPRFRSIAQEYRRHGERFQVRWDYAFFQMALETNFLSFRRGDGKRGDVHPSQNNFAGLGTTGGGVPGDRYPDVSTGVLAQIQHLVVYSGERLERPVGHRTRLKQDVILQSIGKIARERPVTFGDLARRWAADRQYDRSIQRLAGLFFAGYCQSVQTPRSLPASARQKETAPQHIQMSSTTYHRPARLAANAQATPPRRHAPSQSQTAPLPTKRPIGAVQKPKSAATASLSPRSTATSQPPPSQLKPPQLQSSQPAQETKAAIVDEPTPLPLQTEAPNLNLQAPSTAPAAACHVQVASFGGNRTVLIESVANDRVSLTALNVHPGFEVAMATTFIESHAPNGRTIGAFESRDTAVQKAHDICRQRLPSVQK